MTGDATGRDGGLELPRGGRVRGAAVRRVGSCDLVVALTAVPPRLPASAAGARVRWVCWPDFGLPLSTRRAVTELTAARGRVDTERVVLACGSGVGRTGTALALLLVLDGMDAVEAIAAVRRGYHPRAVETPWQRGWLRRVAGRLAE